MKWTLYIGLGNVSFGLRSSTVNTLLNHVVHKFGGYTATMSKGGWKRDGAVPTVEDMERARPALFPEDEIVQEAVLRLEIVDVGPTAKWVELTELIRLAKVHFSQETILLETDRTSKHEFI